MASVLKLKTDIKKLKAAIASKATSGAIKTKLRGKLTTLENELDKLQPNKRKPKTTGPKSESALVKLAKKRRTNQGLSTSKSDIERDSIRPAKKAGMRISANGNRYYEYRDNRVDNRQPPKKYRKLADGGYMAKGGTAKTILDNWDNLDQKVKEETLYSSGIFDRSLAKKYSTQNLKSLPEEVKVQVYLSSGGQRNVQAMGYKEYLFNFVGGGWNSVWAKNEKQAIKLAKEKYENSTRPGVYVRNVDENTFRVKTDSEYKKLMSEFYAKGGKTKEQEVVRGYFEDEAYEYGDGGKMDKYSKPSHDSKEGIEITKKAENVWESMSSDERVKYLNKKLANQKGITDEANMKIISMNAAKPWEDLAIRFQMFVEEDVYTNKMADGGSVAKGNYEMLLSQAKEVMHHAKELMNVAKPDMDVEAWVVAKAERAATDLSDITHYLDGLKMAMGGMVKHNTHKVNA